MLWLARQWMVIGCAWVALISVPLAAFAQLERTSPSAKPEPPKATFPTIEAAIKGLGNDDFDIRQQASEFLWRTGKPAQAELEVAAKDPDAEVRLRAMLLLRKIRLGITPETPVEIQQLIAAYYDGDRNTRQRVINDLRQRGSFPTIFALLQIETDATTRQLFFTTLQSDVHRLAPQMIAANDWTVLEQWLELGKGTDPGRAQLVAYWLLRDRLPQELEKAQQELAKSPTDPAIASLVAMLLRAQGQHEQALAVASAATFTTPALLQGLSREQGDWARLLKLHETKVANVRLESHRLALRGMAFRLAQDVGSANTAFEQLTAHAASDDVWYAGKALLLNDRPGEAIKLMSPGLQPMAFDLLVQRQEHVAALALAGVTNETVFDQEWLSKLTGQQSVRTSKTIDRFTYAAAIAAELRVLGKQQQYDKLHAFLMQAAEADDQRGAYWYPLAKLERGAGRQRELLNRYSRAVDRNHDYIFTQLFPKRLQPIALTWWQVLGLEARPLPPAVRLNAVAVALLPKTFKSDAEEIWPAARKIAEARAAMPETDSALRARIHVALAEAWQARGDREEADKQYQAAVSANPVSAEAYGDALLTEQRWVDAAAQFERLVTANPGHTLGWYLRGLALRRAGQAEEADKLQRTANLMALSSASRYTLALALNDRNLKDEAREQWQLLQRTGFPEDQYVTIANQYLGNLVAEKSPQAAADHWEQTRFHLLRPGINLLEQAGYLDIGTAIHRLRARHLLASGDKAAAIAELRLCQKLLPANIKLIEEFVPLLTKAGEAKAADELFENSFQIYAKGAKQFPQSAMLNNQAAWIAAISVRRLDEALAFAKDAVRLAPENPSYADTLAEVHFARGYREQALEWSAKALALDPDSKFHAERLEKFRTRELPGK
jgi:tetratricopeptide (TPR) repeat protein